jgi:hypothetical protein
LPPPREFRDRVEAFGDIAPNVKDVLLGKAPATGRPVKMVLLGPTAGGNEFSVTMGKGAWRM